jgi:hypothetical protein
MTTAGAITVGTNSIAFTQITGSGSGTVTTTGTPSSGNLTKFSGSSSITNGDLSGDVTTSGTLATTIASNAVTNAKLAQMAAHTYKGNNTGSTANALDLTATQLTAELNVFTSTLQGLVPGSSGGGTTNFLRADGTWAAPGGGTGTVVYAVISGCLPSSITGTKTTAQMSVSSGQAADSTNAAYITSAGYTWKASNGNAINGTDAASSTLANSTTYHMFLCSGGSGTGTFASASLTPTFPTGYTTYKRRIFSFMTDSSGSPIPYTAIECEGGATINWLATQVVDINTTSQSTTRIAYTLTVPTGIKVQWLYRMGQKQNVTSIILVTSGDETDVATGTPFGAVAPGGDNVSTNSSGTTWGQSFPRDGIVTTNTSGQIGIRGNVGGISVYGFTRGWKDFRRS